MKKTIGLAAIASCISFGASAQSFFDSFDNQTRLAQWSLSGTSSVIDGAFTSDDYLFVPLPQFGGAAFTFNAATALTSVRLSFLYASDGGGTVQFSSGNINQSVVMPAFGTTLDNPGPLGRSFSTEFFASVPQGAPVTLRFQGAGILGINLDNVSIQAVPEPGTYALLAAGLGVVGFMARRRRAAQGEAPLGTA